VLELAQNGLASGDPTGALLRLYPNGDRETVLNEGLISPTGLAIDGDGVIYISNQGQSAGVGEVLRVQLDTP
jgi:sugar lactone lactonase YvrE